MQLRKAFMIMIQTQMVMGHKDISTTMDIYTNVSQEFAFEEYARSMGSEGVDNHLDV